MWGLLNLLNSRNLLFIIGIVIIFGVGYGLGYKTADWKSEASRLAAVERSIKEYEERDKIREEIDNATIEVLKDQMKKYLVGKEKVKKYVKENPTIANRECLDPTGLRLFNMGPKDRD